eukprot:8438191-Alexandrium_andersonii.AAC.1
MCSAAVARPMPSMSHTRSVLLLGRAVILYGRAHLGPCCMHLHDRLLKMPFGQPAMRPSRTAPLMMSSPPWRHTRLMSSRAAPNAERHQRKTNALCYISALILPETAT